MKLLDPNKSHFGRLFYLASLGFKVVSGSLILPSGRFDYEWEPEGVRIKQADSGREMVILFSDYYKYAQV